QSELQVDLRQMILALETAVDLVGMNDTHHGKRVGYIASQIGHKLGFSDQDIHFAFEFGLLHDCGVSTHQMHNSLVNHFDWEDADLHCQIGHHLLQGFEPLNRFAIPVLYHHTPWEELKNLSLSPQEKRMANLIFLADRIDVMSAAHYGKDILHTKGEIVRSIVSYSGSYFDPEMVEAFQKSEAAESFWIALEGHHITRYTWDMGRFESKKLLTIHQLKQFSLILSYIVDQKSPFTAQHSTLVGRLGHYLANRYGLLEDQCDKIEIAGFLHDIGKLRIPDHILDKPGALTEFERSIMNQHSYETFEILRHIDGLEEIPHWAAFHHEGINGTGYPFHPAERDLSIEARIIAVADIFQALVQDRPYRAGMKIDQVMAILDEFVEGGKVDPSIVEIIRKDQQHCFQIARGEVDENPLIPFPILMRYYSKKSS
ncbi:MAG TPA: HD domain-containing protein, partial [Gammaproteobacteria bacterium]|nr:HD domain-containing protein [Gammaproteobacteria bacterium]HIJ24563.1 HD domain-containing protein [Gammaproteobacteria bacterium]